MISIHAYLSAFGNRQLRGQARTGSEREGEEEKKKNTGLVYEKFAQHDISIRNALLCYCPCLAVLAPTVRSRYIWIGGWWIIHMHRHTDKKKKVPVHCDCIPTGPFHLILFPDLDHIRSFSIRKYPPFFLFLPIPVLFVHYHFPFCASILFSAPPFFGMSACEPCSCSYFGCSFFPASYTGRQ